MFELFVLHGELWDSASHRGPPGEGSPRQNSPPDCFDSPPALFYCLDFADFGRRPKALPLDSASL